MKVSKNILTDKSIIEELAKHTRATLIFDTVILALTLIVYVPLVVLSVYLASVATVLGIICAIAFAAIPGHFVYLFIKNVRALRSAKNGDFVVAKDSVSRLESDVRVSRNQRGDVIYFAEHGRYVCFSKTVFDLSDNGDEFYVVLLPTDKKGPSLAYPLKLYEYNK